MDLQTIENEALKELEKAGTLPEIESLYSRVLGRKDGQLTQILRNLGSLAPDEKKRMGQAANELRNRLEDRISAKQKSLEANKLAINLEQSRLDLTLPGPAISLGHIHPITQAIREITAIFKSLGYESVEGPEIESDFYNFTALNIPENHPARDLHDTFYLNLPYEEGAGEPVLRTHTSPVQIRLMKEVKKAPVRIIAPGRVYRHEATDATHAAIFHQVEGLAIDKDLSFADLKGTLQQFAQRYFGGDLAVRFRPGYFPFVEPGAEMDVQCFMCRGSKKLPSGSACNVCKATGWIELLGAGMVHPNVFKWGGFTEKGITGFAFGIGIERMIMTRERVRDIRAFLESDLRFLEQFL